MASDGDFFSILLDIWKFMYISFREFSFHMENPFFFLKKNVSLKETEVFYTMKAKMIFSDTFDLWYSSMVGWNIFFLFRKVFFFMCVCFAHCQAILHFFSNKHQILYRFFKVNGTASPHTHLFDTYEISHRTTIKSYFYGLFTKKFVVCGFHSKNSFKRMLTVKYLIPGFFSFLCR